jgi:4-methyl-5(b-hydroxyethyl)-thiazole monophosphate biosynthesis
MLAPGFEEIEAITPVDILRRAGLVVQTVAVLPDAQTKSVVGAHKLSILCDLNIQEAELMTAELVVLPGGMPGTLNLENNKHLLQSLTFRMENDLPVAAICAAPSILGNLGLLNGRKVTCYPGYEDRLIGATCLSDPVVVDNKLITSKGPGTAIAFALALVSLLRGPQVAESIAAAMQYDS